MLYGKLVAAILIVKINGLFYDGSSYVFHLNPEIGYHEGILLKIYLKMLSL